MRQTTLYACLLVALIAAPAVSHAVSLITIAERDGAMTRTWIDGSRVRVQGSGDSYLLLNTRFERFYAVFPTRRDAMNLAADLPQLPADAPANNNYATSLEHTGSGPRIAGYNTERYRMLGNRRTCGYVYLSRDAMERAAAADYLRTMSEFNQRQRLASRRAGEDLGACEAAQQTAMANYPELGLPMRTVDERGTVQQEVVSIQTRTPVEHGFFDLPR
ncbi:hypothetical protein J2T57_000755 [Natronocella acetinitrilica]|uniref:DUF4412 domain-containing protein n=1 Tax=Natronocella acetinitrilica TaxID=414046 RepID=A0AAE3KAP0_9GAMM|nr:hypothetical protein [Natronocella acetinitrilica]MCP1673656.1 hypothetical protein [Natronocella acetinitrilica]